MCVIFIISVINILVINVIIIHAKRRYLDSMLTGICPLSSAKKTEESEKIDVSGVVQWKNVL